MGGMRAGAERARFFLTAAAVLLGCAALAARPAGGPTASGLPDISLIVVVVVGMIGVTAPVPSQSENLLGRVQWSAAVVLGVAAFAAARLLTAPIGPPVTALAAASTLVAAVAEEAFFRRLVYGWPGEDPRWPSWAPPRSSRWCTCRPTVCAPFRWIWRQGSCLAGSGWPPGDGPPPPSLTRRRTCSN